MKGVTSGILLAFLVTFLVTNGVNKVDAVDGDLPLCPVTDAPSGDNTSPSSVAVTTNPANTITSTPSSTVTTPSTPAEAKTSTPSTTVTTTPPTGRKRRAANTIKCRNPSGSGVTGLAGSLFGVTAGCVLVYLGV